MYDTLPLLMHPSERWDATRGGVFSDIVRCLQQQSPSCDGTTDIFCSLLSNYFVSITGDAS